MKLESVVGKHSLQKHNKTQKWFTSMFIATWLGDPITLFAADIAKGKIECWPGK